MNWWIFDPELSGQTRWLMAQLAFANILLALLLALLVGAGIRALTHWWRIPALSASDRSHRLMMTIFFGFAVLHMAIQFYVHIWY